MLSNTAVPKYYGAFRDRVLAGDIPVCETISMQMNRIDALIADPNMYYDDEAVEGWIRFCETELTLTDGSDFVMLDSFKLWGEDVYGWWYFQDRSVYEPNPDGRGGHFVRKKIKRRLCNKQYLIVARGAAKTMYDESHQSYFLVVDRDTTQQATCGPTMRHAEEVLAPFKTAIVRSRGPLFKFLTFGTVRNTAIPELRAKLCSTKRGIENFMTNSVLEMVPMTIAKFQGRRDKCVTIDEWLSCDINEDVVGAAEQGASKVDDYLIIASSSEGTVRNGVGDTIKIELMDILKGEYYAPNVSIWWYKLDNIKEVADPEMWIKANPNIGLTISYDVYQRDVERAENAPAARNDILAKRFGIPSEGYTYFFTYEETKPHRPRKYWKMPCSLGCDMSQGDDFCAFTFLFPLPNFAFGVKARSYITERTYQKLSSAMRYKYDEFIQEGTLIVMNGVVLDMEQVYEDLVDFILANNYDVCSVGYDPYNAQTFIERWCRENGEFAVEKVPQGARTESVPLGELKNLAELRLLLFDESIMSFAMGNCIALEDTNGNRKLYKARRSEKIDNVAAMLDAYVAYKLYPDLYV